MAMARCGPGNLVCIMVSINRALPSLGDECLAPRRALFPLEVNLGRPGRRGHSAESRQGRVLANLHLRLYSTLSILSDS